VLRGKGEKGPRGGEGGTASMYWGERDADWRREGGMEGEYRASRAASLGLRSERVQVDVEEMVEL